VPQAPVMGLPLYVVMMAYGFVLLAPWSLPCCGRMGSVVGLWVGSLRVRLGFFFLEFVEVSVLSLVVHCCGRGFSYGLHVSGGFLVHCIKACTFFCSFYP